jgi:cytochrome c oxidase subunit I+III
MVILLLVAGSLYLAYVFSYLYLWTVSPQVWPKPGALPTASWPAISAALLVFSSVVLLVAARMLSSAWPIFSGLVLLATLALCAALGVEFYGQWQSGLRADRDAHGAMVFMAAFLQSQLTLPLVVFAAFTIARHGAGLLDRRRRVVFDNLSLLWHYTVAQSLLGLLLVHGFPRLAG